MLIALFSNSHNDQNNKNHIITLMAIERLNTLNVYKYSLTSSIKLKIGQREASRICLEKTESA